MGGIDAGSSSTRFDDRECPVFFSSLFYFFGGTFHLLLSKLVLTTTESSLTTGHEAKCQLCKRVRVDLNAGYYLRYDDGGWTGAKGDVGVCVVPGLEYTITTTARTTARVVGYACLFLLLFLFISYLVITNALLYSTRVHKPKNNNRELSRKTCLPEAKCDCDCDTGFT